MDNTVKKIEFDEEIVRVERKYFYPNIKIQLPKAGTFSTDFHGFADDITEEKGSDAPVVKKLGPKDKVCLLCRGSPCLLDRNYDVITNAGLEMEAHGNGEFANKELRFAMYAAAAKAIFGTLGAGNRRELPRCVTSYIHDCYPEKSLVHYFGYLANGDVGFDSDISGIEDMPSLEEN